MMRINATSTGLSPYRRPFVARQPRQTASGDSVRFGICPVCATAGVAATAGLVSLGIKLLAGGKKDPACTKEASNQPPPIADPPQSPPTQPNK